MFQLALQDRHLFLLSFAITVTDDVIVLLFDLVQLYLGLYDLVWLISTSIPNLVSTRTHLLASVLQIPHE